MDCLIVLCMRVKGLVEEASMFIGIINYTSITPTPFPLEGNGSGEKISFVVWLLETLGAGKASKVKNILCP